eukprot:scpid88426/ scgid25423/ 
MFCPTGGDSWCGWQFVQAGKQELYQHHNTIPEAVVKDLMPIYNNLTDILCPPASLYAWCNAKSKRVIKWDDLVFLSEDLILWSSCGGDSLLSSCGPIQSRFCLAAQSVVIHRLQCRTLRTGISGSTRQREGGSSREKGEGRRDKS